MEILEYKKQFFLKEGESQRDGELRGKDNVHRKEVSRGLDSWWKILMIKIMEETKEMTDGAGEGKEKEKVVCGV